MMRAQLKQGPEVNTCSSFNIVLGLPFSQRCTCSRLVALLVVFGAVSELSVVKKWTNILQTKFKYYLDHAGDELY